MNQFLSSALSFLSPVSRPRSLPNRVHRRIRHGRRQQFFNLPRETGPLGLLANRQLLVVLDLENIAISVQRAGFELRVEQLADLFRRISRACELHAVFTTDGKNDWERHLLLHGWTPHARKIDPAASRRCRRPNTNSDFTLAFVVGHLAAARKNDIVLATGDGELGSDLARGLRESKPTRDVFTLAVDGAASAMLDARRNSDISGNLALGLDCVQPLAAQDLWLQRRACA